MRHEDQRRIPRVNVCCRVDVRDQFGIWTAVTDDVCARGCQIISTRLPRVGSVLELVISSDLFAESLEIAGEVAWVSEDRVGVNFSESSAAGAAPGRRRRRRLSPAEWVENVVDHGRVVGPTLGPAAPRVAPVVRRSAGPLHEARRGAEDGRREGDVLLLPIRKA